MRPSQDPPTAPDPTTTTAADPNAPPFGTDWRRFLIGYAGLWALFAWMDDSGPGPSELAAALAVTIAGGATVLYGPSVLHNVGLLSDGGTP